jgi:hypothetical protein
MLWRRLRPEVGSSARRLPRSDLDARQAAFTWWCHLFRGRWDEWFGRQGFGQSSLVGLRLLLCLPTRLRAEALERPFGSDLDVLVFLGLLALARGPVAVAAGADEVIRLECGLPEGMPQTPSYGTSQPMSQTPHWRSSVAARCPRWWTVAYRFVRRLIRRRPATTPYRSAARWSRTERRACPLCLR